MSYQPLRIPRHEERIVRGVKHHLTCWGPPSEAPILLLHGYLDCGATWQFLADCLPEDWSLVAPDWRGFGGSGWAPGGYWFPDYLADLDELLEALVPGRRACVIGHSMGANVAALYAGVRPQRLSWLVNLEGVGLPRVSPELAPSRYEQWLDELRAPLRINQYESVEQLARILRQRNPRLPGDRAEFIARAWSRSVDASAPEVTLTFDPRHRHVNPVLYRLEEAQACWARVEIPMLLIAGGHSGHLERRQAEGGADRLRELFRELSIVTLSGAGHMMHHEAPEGVARCVLEFERVHPRQVARG